MKFFITKLITACLYYFHRYFHQHEKIADFIAFFPFSTLYRWIMMTISFFFN